MCRGGSVELGQGVLYATQSLFATAHSIVLIVHLPRGLAELQAHDLSATTAWLQQIACSHQQPTPTHLKVQPVVHEDRVSSAQRMRTSFPLCLVVVRLCLEVLMRAAARYQELKYGRDRRPSA